MRETETHRYQNLSARAIYVSAPNWEPPAVDLRSSCATRSSDPKRDTPSRGQRALDLISVQALSLAPLPVCRVRSGIAVSPVATDRQTCALYKPHIGFIGYLRIFHKVRWELTERLMKTNYFSRHLA